MAATPIVGRADELARLTRHVRAAAEGRFGAVVVHGDAGVGKTSLVRAALADVGEDVLVLFGTCLPLTGVSVPLLGIRSAVRGLRAGDRPRGLTDPAGGEPVMLAVDEWLTERAEERPVVLAVDDLQWAEAGTLDVLHYVLAGAVDRRLAVLLTVRTSDVGPAHPVHGWLADVRRLPGVSEQALGPLSRDDLADVVAEVLGGPAHSTLVDEVFDRSGGNPYFARLLVRGLDVSARSLPAHLPDELSAAVVRPWGSLSRDTRRLLVTLAVGGRPVAGPTLARAADIAGLDHPGAAVREAADVGLLDLADDGTVWFHHPLQAEALEQGLVPDDRRALHAGFAVEYARELAEGDGAEPDLVQGVSDHFALAGDDAAAYAWAIRAADLARTTGDRARRARMLARAVDLWPRVPDPEEPLVDLVEALRTTARAVGDWEGELAATERLRELVDPAEDPLRAAVLRAWSGLLRFRLGIRTDPEDLRVAVELAAHGPDSWQRVVVLCESSRMTLWAGDLEGGVQEVDEALAICERVPVDAGAPDAGEWARARAFAYGQQLMADTFVGGHASRAEDLWRRAVEAAGPVGDGGTILHATFWNANCRSDPGPEMAAIIDRGRTVLEEVGAPHRFVAWLTAGVAGSTWCFGDVADVRSRLRVALGADAGHAGNYIARLTAAVLAACQGRQAEADAHLTRARELIPDADSTPNFMTAAAVATVLVHRGDALAAADTAEAALRAPGARPTWVEWLAPLAARALADLVEEDVDAGRGPQRWRDRLTALSAHVPHAVEDPGLNAEPYQRMVAALDALYEAERARAGLLDDAASRWCRAADALDGVSLAWDACYAAWRAGEELLRQGGERRREAAAVLRRGHATAVRIGADPVRERIESLARAARIPLAPVRTSATSGGGVHLTAREREVLGHVVAGRTYAEMADALFLSEKTVSSHVSNLLHKTGAANRVELAAWAMRQDG